MWQVLFFEGFWYNNFMENEELIKNVNIQQLAEEGNRIYGTCALHIAWENLGEVKSLAVDNNKHKRGIGTALLHACMAEAKTLGIKELFVLTYIPKFFKKHGFRRISKDRLPHKIWGECISCVKFPDCNEEPLMLELK